MNWQTKRLGDVLKLEYGKPLPKSDRGDGGKYPVYGANGIKNWSDSFYHDRETIIVGRKGSAGEINLTQEKFWPLDVTYFVTFDEKKYDLKFLHALLSTLELTKLAKGVKPGINRNDVYNINVRTPTLFEQQRIVKILDGVFENIAKVKENTEKNLQNSKDLFESYLQSIFANPEMDWTKKVLGDIVKTTQGIQIPKSLHHKTPSIGYKRYLYISDFDHNNNLKYIEDKYPTKIVTENDLIVVNTGASAGTIFRGIDGILSNNLFKVSFDSKILDTDFIYYFVTSDIFKKFQAKIVRGTANPHMGHENFNATPFFLPAYPEQKAIVAKLDALSEQTKKLEVIYKKKLEDLEELKKSVLQKAFAGEL